MYIRTYADRCPNATQEEKEEMEKAFKEVRTHVNVCMHECAKCVTVMSSLGMVKCVMEASLQGWVDSWLVWYHVLP